MAGVRDLEFSKFSVLSLDICHRAKNSMVTDVKCHVSRVPVLNFTEIEQAAAELWSKQL